MADVFGSQAVIVAVDVDENSGGRIFTHSGKNKVNLDFIEFARLAEEKGAGEILFQSPSRDGKLCGYFLDGIRQFFNLRKIRQRVLANSCQKMESPSVILKTQFKAAAWRRKATK